MKYKIDFNELNEIAEAIRSKFYFNTGLNMLFNVINIEKNYISVNCLDRHKFIEQREYSYISDIELYKQIEKAYELYFLLSDVISLEILWNKEITRNFDNNYKFLRNIANIYLRETDGLVKEIEMRGNHEDKKDTNENLCSYKRKV